MTAPRSPGFQSPGFQNSRLPRFQASKLFPQKKDSRSFMYVNFFFSPTCDILSTDRFCCRGKINRNTHPRPGVKHPGHRLNQRIIPIRRFNENMCGAGRNGISLQFFQCLLSVLFLYRQISVKLELLAIKTTGHQGEKDGTGPYKWVDAELHLLRQGDEILPGIGNPGTAGIADDADVFAGAGLRAEICGGAFILDDKPRIIIDHHFFPDLFQEAARASFVLYKEHLALLHGGQYFRAQRVQGIIGNGTGNEK